MARMHDYAKALDMAKKALSTRDPLQVCRLSGASFEEGDPDTIRFRFLNRTIGISWPGLAFSQDANGEIPVMHQILILHYLIGSGKEGLTGELISFQDILSAKFYLDAFNRRVKYPLINAFGKQPEKLLLFAKDFYGASLSPVGGFSVNIQALPKIPITLVIWEGDEEFPSDGTVLFDSSIKDILSAEDIVVLASMVVYPLLKNN